MVIRRQMHFGHELTFRFERATASVLFMPLGRPNLPRIHPSHFSPRGAHQRAGFGLALAFAIVLWVGDLPIGGGPSLVARAEAKTAPTRTPVIHPNSVSTSETRVWLVDLNHFTVALESAKQGEEVEKLQKLYLDAASPGLQLFVQDRIAGASFLLDRLNAAKKYYVHLYALNPVFVQAAKDIDKAVAAFRELYPELPATEIYFVQGGLTDRGARASGILAIAVDYFGADEQAPLAELGLNFAPRLRSPADIVAFAMQSLALSAQADADAQVLSRGGAALKAPSLLEFALIEGQADFFAEHLTGRLVDAADFTRWSKLEGRYWNAFLDAASQTDITRWGQDASGSASNQIPLTSEEQAGLARLYGYRIAKSFFANAKDKQQAARELLRLTNSVRIVAGSTYDPTLAAIP